MCVRTSTFGPAKIAFPSRDYVAVLVRALAVRAGAAEPLGHQVSAADLQAVPLGMLLHYGLAVITIISDDTLISA